MNEIQKAKLNLMYKNLHDLLQIRNSYYHAGKLDQVSKYDVKIKLKKDDIRDYRERIGDNMKKDFNIDCIESIEIRKIAKDKIDHLKNKGSESYADRLKNIRLGLSGEKIISKFNDYNNLEMILEDPAFNPEDQSGIVYHDAKLKDGRTVNIKTIGNPSHNMIITCDQFHVNPCDIYILVYFNGTTGTVMGYQTKEYISNLPITKKGEHNFKYDGRLVPKYDLLDVKDLFNK